MRSLSTIVIMNCAVLSACSALAPAARPPDVPPGLFGVYQDNDIGAMNHAVWAFADAGRTRDDPIDAARAVIAIEYLANELRSSPRWVEVSASAKNGMVRARTDVRRSLGIREDAPPGLVVDSLSRVVASLHDHNQAAAAQAVSTPAFTLPPAQTLRILSDLPTIPSANVATNQTSNEALRNGRH